MEVLGHCIYCSEGFLYFRKEASKDTGRTVVQCIRRDICTAEAYIEDEELSLYKEHNHSPFEDKVIEVKTKDRSTSRVTRSSAQIGISKLIIKNINENSYEKLSLEASCKSVNVVCEKLMVTDIKNCPSPVKISSVHSLKKVANKIGGQNRLPSISEANYENSSDEDFDSSIEPETHLSEPGRNILLIENYKIKKERASVTPPLDEEEIRGTGSLEVVPFGLPEVENTSDDRDDYDEDDYEEDEDYLQNPELSRSTDVECRLAEYGLEGNTGSKAELIEGSYRNSNLYLQDGFLYVKNVSNRNQKSYMRCSLQRRYPFCYSRGIMQNGHIQITKGHNHLPDPIQVDELRLKARCKRRAETDSNTNLETIFNEEVSNFQNSSFEFRPSFFGSKRRKFSNPKKPKNMEDFVQVLQENEQRFCNTLSGPSFFSGFITSNDFSIVTFISPAFNHRMEQVEVLHIDRTFQDVPFLFTHMFTALIVLDNCVFPLVYALMTTDTEAAYTILLNFLKQQIPSLNPKMVILDFDQKLVNAVNIVYPLAEIQGGLFNYGLAVWREVQEKNFITNYTEDKEAQLCTRMLLSLPLLPPEFVELGFCCVQERIQRLQQGGTILHGILDFVHYCWLNRMGIRSFSMVSKPQRASYDVDAYLSKFRHKVGSSSGCIWNFIDRLKQFEDVEKKEMEKVSNSQGKPGRKRKVKCVLTNNKVRELIKKLEEKKITVQDFLEAVLPFVSPPTKDAYEMYIATYSMKLLPQYSALVQVLTPAQMDLHNS